jgi:large repetitive protein
MIAECRLFQKIVSLLRFSNYRAAKRNAPFAAVELCALILVVGMSVAAPAQTFSGLGVQATVPVLAGTNPNGPSGVVVDSAGDLLIADFSNGRVVDVPQGCVSTSCESVVPTTGVNEPTGLAVDPTGDLFIADFAGNVFEVPWSGTAWETQVTIDSGLPNPAGVALDKSGNLYVAEYNGGAGGLVVEYPWEGGTTWGTPVTVVNWLSGPFGLAFDGANDLFVADFGGQQVVEVPSGCASMACQVLVANVGLYGGHPKAVAVDAAGDVYVDNTTGDTPSVFVAEVPVASYGCAFTTCLVGIGYGLNSPAGVALDASNNIYIGDYGNSRMLEVGQNSFNLGTVDVGSTSAAVTAYFDFAASSTLNATTPSQVLTQGQSGLDFADAGGEGGNGCVAGGYVAGDTCIVNLDLAPQSAGLVAGAVTLVDNTNARIATLYLSGTGSGPEVTFFPNPLTFGTRGGGLIWGRGLTVDRKGNIFVADSSDNSADEYVAASSYSQSILSTSFSGPTDVAIDGAGNVFVADTGHNDVKELLAPAYTATNTVGSGFNAPAGVAIDGAGNVFVADAGDHAIKETVAPAYTVTKTLNSASFTSPSAIATDANGNLFVADSSLGSVSELTAASGYATVTSPVTGLAQPSGVAIDASGNVYVADTGHTAVDEFLAASSYAKFTLTSTFANSSGLALDAAGNVYVTASGHPQVGVLELSAAPTLSFGTISAGTTSSPVAVTVSNIGNANLTFPVAGAFDATTQTNGSFKLDASATCTASPLALGTNCTDAIDFSPAAAQSYTGTYTLTDNNLNTPSPYATQAINLNGTGVTISFVTTSPLSSGTVGVPFTPQTLQVSGGSGNYTFAITGGALPAGLALSSSGTISGTPTAGGTFTGIQITVTDTSTTLTDSQTYSMTIAPATITLATASLPDATYNTSYSQAIPAASGGTAPYTYTLSSGTMPPGLTVAPSTGVISGIPTQGGSYPNFVIQATDSSTGTGPYSTTQTYSLTVDMANQATLTVTGVPVTAQAYQATFTVGSAGGSGTGAVTFAASGACSNTAGGALITMSSGTGTCSVTATKAADTNYNSTTSVAATVSAALANQATLTVTGVPVTAQAYQATFTVGSAGGSGTGALTFAASGACSNTAGGALITMSSGTGTCSVTTTKAADTNYNSATSVAATVSATLANQATLTVTGVPVTAQAYQATFTVGSAGGSGTGALTFAASGACSNTAGGALITMSSGTGTCSVTATKVADTNYNSTTSVAATVSATLANQATLTVTGVPVTPQAYQATFTVGSAGGSGTGAVTFAASGACSNTAGGALITMSSGTGTCSVTATKAADTNYNSTTSVAATVSAALANQATLTVTGVPVTAQAYQATFTVGSAGGSGTGALTFAASGACTNTAGGALITMSSGTGTCSVTATKAADTNYNTTTSVAATVSATLANQATLTVTGVPVTPQAYQATFTVGSAGGSGTGAITFAASGACSNTAGGALITMSSGTGTCSVTATKAADTNYNSATSAAATVSATMADQATLTVNVSSPAAYNSQQTLTATGGSGTGALTYGVGASTACSVSGATLTITSGTGTCSVTVTKAADANYNSATSTAATVTVQTAIAIVTTLPTASPITYGQTLSESTLTGGSATPSAGSFQWVTPSAVPLAGTQTESVIFVPTDTADYSSSAPSSISVTVNPASFIVTVSTDDAGTASNCTPQTTPGHGTDASCSLRDALLEAAAAGGGDITFDATAFGTAKTITLGNGTLNISSATTIAGTTTGSGATLANLVTVDGNSASTVFTIGSGVTGASIANLTIQHGNNAGIQNAGALTLTDDSIISNTATGSGGGVNNSGALTLTGSTISGNSATGSGGGISNSGTLTLSDDTISGNSATASGGGINNTATLIASDTTLSGNSAVTASGGGGIDNTGSGTAALANDVVSGNTSNSAADDFDGVAYTDQGGNIVGVSNGVTVNASAIDLAPLGSYGGPTQTLIPLPSSTAICAGVAAQIPSGLTTDQRGLPNTNASYPGYATCVDAGAVQTNYALSFTTEPTGVSVATNFAAAVTLTESGSPFQPGVTIPLTLTGSGALTGGSATTSAGVASYTLQVDTAGSGDQLTANLALNGALAPAVAISAASNTFNVGLTTPTVVLSLSSNSITYGTLETLTANVPVAATGSVSFYNNGTTLLGTGPVSGGVATFASSTLTAGSYSITAAYSGDSNYNPNTSSASLLTINPANQATLTVTGMPVTAQAYGATFTVGTSGGSGTGAITFAAGGACSVDANSGLVTMTSGTGTCSVTATKAADTNYNSATSVAVTVSATLASQTALSVNASSPATYNTQQTLTTTGGSGTGAITYSVGASTACSVSGATLSITQGTGTCSVTATKAADANYSSATSVAATITVQSANQAALTVNASSPATYNTQQTLTTTGGSGTGAITYSVGASTACSVSGATLSITSGTGTCSVTATKAADANYNSTTSVAATVTVQLATQAALTVNVASPAAYNMQQTLTTTGGSGTGAITYSVGASTACSVSGATLSITSGTGTCSVTATKAADANYSSTTSTAASVTVQPANQTITFTPASPVTYGISPITLSATGGASGNPVTFSLVSGPAMLSGTTLTVTGIGTINLTANQAGNANYSAATPVSQSIVVNQAPLTVAANNAMRVYGVVNPTFTGSVMGAVDGNTFTESFSTTATITSNAGPYNIVPTAMGADLADYSVTVQDGTLTISQAGSTTSLVTTSGSITPGQSVTLTAQVTSATTGTPTGSVNFYDGATLLDTAPLSAGTASFTTSALSAGITHQLTAVYSGDINFTASSTSQSTPVVVAALDFTLSPAVPVGQSVNAGATATYQVVVAPLYGTYPGTVTFTVTGLPSGAVATFAPSSIPANGGQQTVVMSIQTAAATAAVQPSPLSGRTRVPLALALLLLPLIGARRLRRHGKGLSRTLCALLLLLGMATMALSGCVSHPKSLTATNYTLTITATSGNLQHSTDVNLDVQ